MFEFDPHTHSIASGHGSSNTITDLAKQASKRNLNMLGISDHGPATPHSSHSSYFRSLAYAPKKRCGIELLYGVELNILDNDGTVDLDDEILERLDYAIISMHPANKKPDTVEKNTFAYIHAMRHPKVKIIGHCDDVKYLVDYEALILAAIHYHVVPEINNSSLTPGGYRGDTQENVRTILKLCQRYRHPVVLSSDSHGIEHVGDFQYAQQLIQEMHFPESLILNTSSKKFKHFLGYV